MTSTAVLYNKSELTPRTSSQRNPTWACPKCNLNLSPDNKGTKKNVYSCKTKEGCGYRVMVIDDSNDYNLLEDKDLSLFQFLNQGVSSDVKPDVGESIPASDEPDTLPPITSEKQAYSNAVVRAQARQEEKRLAPSIAGQSLTEYVRKHYKNKSSLTQWLEFCDKHPDMQWFEVTTPTGERTILFPIPLAEKLKANNPDEFGLVWDYSKNFADKKDRVSLRSSEKQESDRIPPHIAAIAAMDGTQDVYQVKGFEDRPDCWGFLLKGGRRSHGTAAYQAHQQLGQHLTNCNIFHAVTFPLFYAYMVRGRSEVSTDLQKIGAYAIEDSISNKVEEKKENTPASELVNAAPFSPQLQRVEEQVEGLIRLISITHSETQEVLKRLEVHMVKMQTEIERLEFVPVNDMTSAMDWLEKVDRIESLLIGIGHSVDEAHQMMGKVIMTKRQRVTDKVRDLHTRFVHVRYHGYCPVTNNKIVKLNESSGEPEIIKDEQGRPVAEVDHNFQVNKAGKLTTWLICRKLNESLNNYEQERIRVQSYFQTYQDSLDQFESPLLNI